MTWFDAFSLLIASLYFLGTLAMLAGLLLRRPPLQKAALGLSLTGFALHTIILAALLFGLTGFDTTGGAVDRGFFVQVFAWVLLLIFFLLWRGLRSAFLGLAVAPVSLIAYLSSFTIRSDAAPSIVKGVFGWVHIGSLFLSVALATVACVAGVLFLYMDGKIKNKTRLTNFDREMPALSVFDRINHVAALAGFPLFTIGMFVGFMNAGKIWGATLSWDPKEVVSLIVWALYGVWFYQRLIRGARGRKVALMAIVIFIACVFSMFGVNIFMDTHHSFRA